MTARSFKNLKGCSIDLAKYLAQKEMMNPNFYRPKNMSRIHPKAYDIVFFFIVLSGLNIEMLNNNFLFEFVTPVRLGWLIILVFLTFTLKFKYIGFSAPFYFLGGWILIHIFNLVFIGGVESATLTRIIQSIFIGILLLSISSKTFCIINFSKSATPLVSVIAALLFILFLFTMLTNGEASEILRVSIIGNPANFSIFCAQLIAFFFLKDLATSTPSKPAPYSMLFLSVMPILLWQLASAGRAGFILTLFAILGFAFAKHGKRGALIFILCCFSIFVGYFIVFGMIANAFNFSPGGRIMGGQALLRNISTLRDLFLFQADQQIFVETLDVIASGRISIIHETLQVLDLRTFLFGVGVDKFKVLEGQHYPHVELLRYIAELGVLGFVVVMFIYIYPFRNLTNDQIGIFSFFYMLGFMVTTLFQPSGPLTHLNNSVLFWMLFGNVILVTQDKFKFMNKVDDGHQ